MYNPSNAKAQMVRVRDQQTWRGACALIQENILKGDESVVSDYHPLPGTIFFQISHTGLMIWLLVELKVCDL